MKVIVSHDVDHITFWEHRRDFIVPKFMIRYFLEMTFGQITINEFSSRIRRILKNKWHNLEELMAFNKQYNIPSTFFIGVSNGNGLVYSTKDAEFWVKRIMQEGFDVGVHGIAFDNYEEIKHEYDTFKRISGNESFGIRMHYLRNSQNMLEYLSKAGYTFDSTIYKIERPYKINTMWEFPLFIMDVYIVRKKSILQNQSFEQIKVATLKTIDDVYKRGIKYITINLHDRFYHESFRIWKKWYIWLIQYFITNNIKFINYSDAIKELEHKPSTCEKY